MLFQEEGFQCSHIIVLIEKGKSLEGKWWFSQRYHISTYHSSYSAEVLPIALPKLDVDLFYAPPDHKQLASRPPKACKDQSWININQTRSSALPVVDLVTSTPPVMLPLLSLDSTVTT